MSKNDTKDDVQDCSTCRFAATDKRPRIMMETGFDDQLMFADDDEVVYSCLAFEGSVVAFMGGDDGGVSKEPFWERKLEHKVALCEHAGKQIGTVPITCAAWSTPTQKSKENRDRLSEIDKMIVAREERQKNKPNRE